MKIAVFGGTGSMGHSLSVHLARRNEVIVASRDAARATVAARGVKGANGSGYREAGERCEAAIVAIPFGAISLLSPLRGTLAGKLVLSAVNPMKVVRGAFAYGLESGSAAESLASLLPESRLATAFNNIPASCIGRARTRPLDVLVAADERETFNAAAGVVLSIPGLRPRYAGPLSEAGTVERITPLILNLAADSGEENLAPMFVSTPSRPRPASVFKGGPKGKS